MHHLLARCVLALVLTIGLSSAASDPDLPGVDLSGLTPAQRTTALKLINARDCGCTCGMKVGECRVKDPNCAYSKGLAETIVNAIRAGKNESEALASASASTWDHLPQRDNRVLGDSVPLATAGAPVLGPANAPIRLVEFSDFQCPFCVLATPEIEKLLKAYPTEVSLTFKQFPLESHSQAALAARAAVAADKQGKFWAMHDALFSQGGHLSQAVIDQIAGKIGLSLMRFEADLQSPEVGSHVEKDVADGAKAGVSGTPTLFINGRPFQRQITLGNLRPVIEEALKASPSSTASAQNPSATARP